MFAPQAGRIGGMIGGSGTGGATPGFMPGAQNTPQAFMQLLQRGQGQVQLANQLQQMSPGANSRGFLDVLATLMGAYKGSQARQSGEADIAKAIEQEMAYKQQQERQEAARAQAEEDRKRRLEDERWNARNAAQNNEWDRRFAAQRGAAAEDLAQKAASQPPEPAFDAKRGDSFRKERYGRIKEFKEQVEPSYARVVASAEDPSAAGDLALIFNYMKILDPGSTVREGEFATAQNAGGVDDRVRSLFNNLQQGQRLSTEQRADFLDRAGRLYGEQLQLAERTIGEFNDLAAANNLPADTIFPAFNPTQVYQPEAQPAAEPAQANGLNQFSDDELLRMLEEMESGGGWRPSGRNGRNR